jgi:hypothetical protein
MAELWTFHEKQKSAVGTGYSKDAQTGGTISRMEGDQVCPNDCDNQIIPFLHFAIADSPMGIKKI